MQERGVEPLRLSAQEPKSCASANSATPAGEPIITLVVGSTVNAASHAQATDSPEFRKFVVIGLRHSL